MKDSEKRRTVFAGKKRCYIYHDEAKTMPFEVKIPGEAKKRFRTLASALRAIDDYGKINRLEKRAYHKPHKSIFIVCECGCGQTGEVTYSTRKPRFINDQHKNKFDYARRVARREARMKELLGKQRARRLGEEKGKKPDADMLVRKVSRKGGVRGGKPGSGFPSLMSEPTKGLYAGETEPTRTAKRSKVGLP